MPENGYTTAPRSRHHLNGILCIAHRDAALPPQLDQGRATPEISATFGGRLGEPFPITQYFLGKLFLTTSGKRKAMGNRVNMRLPISQAFRIVRAFVIPTRPFLVVVTIILAAHDQSLPNSTPLDPESVSGGVGSAFSAFSALSAFLSPFSLGVDVGFSLFSLGGVGEGLSEDCENATPAHMKRIVNTHNNFFILTSIYSLMCW